MNDTIEKLAADVKQSVVNVCAQVAEIHRIPRAENEYQNGYNAAVADIAEAVMTDYILPLAIAFVGTFWIIAWCLP